MLKGAVTILWKAREIIFYYVLRILSSCLQLLLSFFNVWDICFYLRWLYLKWTCMLITRRIKLHSKLQRANTYWISELVNYSKTWCGDQGYEVVHTGPTCLIKTFTRLPKVKTWTLPGYPTSVANNHTGYVTKKMQVS